MISNSVFSQEEFLIPTKQLLQNNQISETEYQNIIQQYENIQKRKQIHNFVSSSSIKNRLLLYIKSQSHFKSQKNINNAEEIISTKSLNTEDTHKQGINSSKSLGEGKTDKGIKPSLIPSFQSISIPKQIQNISEIDIQNFDTNCLDFSSSLNTPFTAEVLSNTSYFTELKVSQQKLGNFIDSLARQYERHNNPYHNFQHGLTVMHTCYILGKMEQSRKLLSPLDYFTLVFSGLCHDAGHTGFNNDFQMKTLSEKALIWNDRSILENYHAYISMKLLVTEENYFLESMSKEDFKNFRKMFIHNILATDMKDHTAVQNTFQQKLKAKQIYNKSQQNIKSLTGILIHASDLSSCVKKVDIALMWSKRINKQMANQYREEERRGVTKSSFMKDLDINPTAACKSQIGFLNHFVGPLYKLINEFQISDKLVVVMLQNMEECISLSKKELEELERQNSKSESK